jgi:hypothetical protein
MMYGGMPDGTVVLDNSGAFQEYLRQNGMDEGLKKHKLKLRTVNKIVPHVSRPVIPHSMPILIFFLAPLYIARCPAQCST